MYPFDAPSTEISGYWTGGAYTPFNVTSYIIDNVTPINKNSLVNSLGKQVSLIETFVNTTYLARSGNYIQNSYLRYIHTASIIGSGWLSTADPGIVYVRSNLYPSYDGMLNLGSGVHQWKNLAATTVNTDYLTPLNFTSISMQADLIPEITDTLSLGTPGSRFGSVQASGVYTDVVVPAYITAPDGVAVKLCSSLVPNLTTIDLGDSTHLFRFGYFTDIWLHTTGATYNAGEPYALWVDTQGFVRVGDVTDHSGL